MISYIRGQLASVEEDKVIVDVGGVGYGIYMSTHSMSLLPSAGNEVKLHTYLNVKEEAMQLFGFLTRDDLQVFKLLIGGSLYKSILQKIRLIYILYGTGIFADCC